MSKVLIDRELLENLLEQHIAEHGYTNHTAHYAQKALTAGSGTPTLPVKAYYHEAPNEHGGFNKSVGLEVRKTFADAPLVLESDATAQIACLEGEIAKRDARIMELEEHNLRLGQGGAERYWEGRWRDADAELSKTMRQQPVGEVVEVNDSGNCSFKGVINASAILEDLVVSGTKLYAAPVSEAKAQGLVMPGRKTKADYGVYIDEFADEAAAIYNAALDEVARLNAAPVQQVSVPDGWRLVPVNATEAILDVLYSNGMDESDSLLQDIWSAMIAAAPAAPAADAGLVEALRELAEQFREAWPDHTGKYHFLIGAGLSIAAHRAKEVV